MEKKMKYRDIKLPNEFMLNNEMLEAAKDQDIFYKTMYESIRKDNQDAKAQDIIALLAKISTEWVSVIIGNSLRDYDKNILMCLIERYIARIVFVEK